MIKSNMHEFHTALISSQTKNIHVNEPDSPSLAKSLSNNTEDYSFLKSETCEALTHTQKITTSGLNLSFLNA